MFRTIDNYTQLVLPDLSRLTTRGRNIVKDFNFYGFGELPMDVC